MSGPVRGSPVAGGNARRLGCGGCGGWVHRGRRGGCGRQCDTPGKECRNYGRRRDESEEFHFVSYLYCAKYKNGTAITTLADYVIVRKSGYLEVFVLT
jgi:hypothetical protein